MKLDKPIRTQSTHFFSLKRYKSIKYNSFLSMMRFAVLCIVGLNLLVGCGGGGKSSSNTPPPTPTPAPTPTLTWSEPALPQTFNTDVITSTRAPKVLTTADSLQLAIDEAVPGDILHLPPNFIFRGNYILKKKTGNEFITIRTASSDSSFSREHTIIDPSKYLSLMAHIISPNSQPVLTAENGAHHYRFIGIEFSTDKNISVNDTLIDLGSAASSAEDLPNNIIFDRVIVHGYTSNSVRRGIALNGSNMAVVDSFLSDFHKDNEDAMAIQIWNGPGPYKIDHNLLDAASESVMIGGTTATFKNVVPADIGFTSNFCLRTENPTTSANQMASIERVAHTNGTSTSKRWNPEYANISEAPGDNWKVGSLIDVRNAQRMLIAGNLIAGSDSPNQGVFGVSLMVRTENGGMPSAIVKEITFIENTVHNSGSGIIISGKDDNGQGLGQHFKIANNMFDRIDSKKFQGDGIFVKLVQSPSLVKLDHNTAIHSGNTGLITGSDKGQVLIFTNNIAYNNQYGFAGEGQGTGLSALNFYYQNSFTFSGNVIVGGNSSVYPSGNNFPATSFNPSVTFDTDLYEFVKTGTIPYLGTDGKISGFDFDTYVTNRYGEK